MTVCPNARVRAYEKRVSGNQEHVTKSRWYGTWCENHCDISRNISHHNAMRVFKTKWKTSNTYIAEWYCAKNPRWHDVAVTVVPYNTTFKYLWNSWGNANYVLLITTHANRISSQASTGVVPDLLKKPVHVIIKLCTKLFLRFRWTTAFSSSIVRAPYQNHGTAGSSPVGGLMVYYICS